MKSIASKFFSLDRSGKFIALRAPAYTSDPNTVNSGKGPYAADEWSMTRRTGNLALGTDGHQYDDDRRYFQYVIRNESEKIALAKELFQHFDFSKYRSILDMGAGEAVQGLVIKNLRSELRYCATDYDPFVVDKCSKLGLFQGIETRVLDVKSVSADDLLGFELLMSWSLDYAISDEELSKLLRCVRECQSDYLLCSNTTIHISDVLISRVRRYVWKKRVSEGGVRCHGFRRSVKLIQQLGSEAGLHSRYLGRFGPYETILFSSK